MIKTFTEIMLLKRHLRYSRVVWVIGEFNIYRINNKAERVKFLCSYTIQLMIWQNSNLALKMSAGRHFSNIIGNIAEKAEENFAFEIEFLLKLPDQLSEKSKIPFVNFLSGQNFDFCGKEKIFSIFEIFLVWKFFF